MLCGHLLFLLPWDLSASGKVEQLGGSSGFMIIHEWVLGTLWCFGEGYDVFNSSFFWVQAGFLFFSVKYFKILHLLPLSVYFSSGPSCLFTEKLKYFQVLHQVVWFCRIIVIKFWNITRYLIFCSIVKLLFKWQKKIHSL